MTVTQNIENSNNPTQGSAAKRLNDGNRSVDPVTRKSGDGVLELGRYRSFLRLKAMGIAPQYSARLEASDLVQQTLLEAHQKLHQFRGQSEPEMAGWLSRILMNNINDAVRALHRKKRDVTRERPIARGGDSSFPGAADWIPAEQTSPSLKAYRSEQMLELSDAIRQLPLAQQEVIVFHHLQGLSLSEVAEKIQRSQSAVAGLLYRGLKSLREKLA